MEKVRHGTDMVQTPVFNGTASEELMAGPCLGENGGAGSEGMEIYRRSQQKVVALASVGTELCRVCLYSMCICHHSSVMQHKLSQQRSLNVYYLLVSFNLLLPSPLQHINE